MANVFLQGDHHSFTWDKLGDIKAGRACLGDSMPVMVYRLLEYSLNDVLAREYGAEQADELLRKGGYLAGAELAKNLLPLDAPIAEFTAALQRTLKDYLIGILRIESLDEKTGEFVLTVGEDLDCSGLPVTGEIVCKYDEGFLEGIMKTYTGKSYCVREIDCWASGDRVCRFRGYVIE